MILTCCATAHWMTRGVSPRVQRKGAMSSGILATSGVFNMLSAAEPIIPSRLLSAVVWSGIACSAGGLSASVSSAAESSNRSSAQAGHADWRTAAESLPTGSLHVRTIK